MDRNFSTTSKGEASGVIMLGLVLLVVVLHFVGGLLFALHLIWPPLPFCVVSFGAGLFIRGIWWP